MKSLIKKMVEKDYIYKCNHLASALSALPILVDIFKTFDFSKDLFYLSKGHACYALYAILEDNGFDVDWSKAHPDIDVKNGIHSTSGSLGHGLPLAVGAALAKKLIGDKEGKIHVLLGDGECQEGSVWEALLIADRFNLDNLFVHIDCNGYQGIDSILYDATNKIKSIFPWVRIYTYKRWNGLDMFKNIPGSTVKEITKDEYNAIMEVL